MFNKVDEKNKLINKPKIEVILVDLEDELVSLNRKFMRGEMHDEDKYHELVKKNRSQYDPKNKKTAVIRVSLKKEKPQKSGKEVINSIHDFAREIAGGFGDKHKFQS